jgi:hypothetical protein
VQADGHKHSAADLVEAPPGAAREICDLPRNAPMPTSLKSGDANKADYTANNGKERFALAVQHQGEGEQAIGAR